MWRPQQRSAEKSAAELRRRAGRIFDRSHLHNQRPRRYSSAADQLDHYRYERRYDDELHVAEHGHDGNDNGSVRIDRFHASANVGKFVQRLLPAAAASATATTGSNDDDGKHANIDKRRRSTGDGHHNDRSAARREEVERSTPATTDGHDCNGDPGVVSSRAAKTARDPQRKYEADPSLRSG
jgi:hypothetical protein